MTLLLGACGGDAVSPAAGAAACATAASCGLVGQTQIQACTSAVLTINDPQLAAFFQVPITSSQVNCLAAAGHSCDAAKKCLNNGSAPSTCSGNGPQSCSSNVMTSCNQQGGSGYTSQFDCGFYGEMCLTGTGNVECGAGTCAAAGTTCTNSSIQTCDNNGVYRLFDCAEVGSQCIPGVIAHCRGTGPACSATSLADLSLRCDGDTLVDCFDGQEARFDCGKTGTHCFANSKGAHAACALGNACDPGNFATTCSGTTLTFCNNGRVDSFDCSAGGWTTCDPATGGRCR